MVRWGIEDYPEQNQRHIAEDRSKADAVQCGRKCRRGIRKAPHFAPELRNSIRGCRPTLAHVITTYWEGNRRGGWQHEGRNEIKCVDHEWAVTPRDYLGEERLRATYEHVPVKHSLETIDCSRRHTSGGKKPFVPRHRCKR